MCRGVSCYLDVFITAFLKVPKFAHRNDILHLQVATGQGRHIPSKRLNYIVQCLHVDNIKQVPEAKSKMYKVPLLSYSPRELLFFPTW